MSPLNVGCCITAHGFGHAARALAVMEELAKLTEIKLTIASQVPEWFLRSSFAGSFSLFPIQTDVGLVQKSPLDQDIPETLKALAEYYPVRRETVRSLAEAFSECSLVICDIAPAGILAARESGIPSVLIENFTWDWIYEGYSSLYPGLESFIKYIKEVNDLANYRIQTTPVCEQVACDLIVSPVARSVRESRESVRHALNVYQDQQMVLVSMGGIGIGQLALDRLLEKRDIIFVISGFKGEIVNTPNLRFLGSDTTIFHPDLVNASDAVIGKVGYSTLAEVYHADVPFGYVSRQDFRESGPLVSFIRKEMRGLEISSKAFWEGEWMDMLPQLFQLEKKGKASENGAGECAKFLMSLLNN